MPPYFERAAFQMTPMMSCSGSFHIKIISSSLHSISIATASSTTMMMILSTTAHSFFATSVILLTVLVSLSSAHLQDEELFHYGGGTSTTTEGVTFTREINKLPGSFDLHFDNNNRCDSQDVHGDNDCHFDWNEDVTGAYKLVIDVPIEEGDQMEGHFKVSIRRCLRCYRCCYHMLASLYYS